MKTTTQMKITSFTAELVADRGRLYLNVNVSHNGETIDQKLAPITPEQWEAIEKDGQAVDSIIKGAIVEGYDGDYIHGRIED
jgi:hypothetical protein